jgi:uncharacterized protein
MHSSNFLNLARQGKNQWWRYLIGILAILICWLVIGGLISIIVAFIAWMRETGMSPVQIQADPDKFQRDMQAWLETPGIPAYVSLNLQFIFFLAGTFMVVKWLHQRPVGSLISGRRSQISLYLLDPATFKFTFDAAHWLPLLPIALILTPLQTSAEEFFFRSYLLQGLGLLLRNRVVLTLLNSIIFAVPHFFNPEMARNPGLMALNYLTMGILLAYITLRDQSLDLALGVHAANNLFGALVVNTEDSVLPTRALITVMKPEHPAISLLVLLLMTAAFCYWFFGRRSQRRVEPD